ncbi:unnamed protein product, partial [Linum tenue]
APLQSSSLSSLHTVTRTKKEKTPKKYIVSFLSIFPFEIRNPSPSINFLRPSERQNKDNPFFSFHLGIEEIPA